MNNKITMGLIGAAIAAMAIAPSFKEDKEKVVEVNTEDNKEPVLTAEVMQEYKNQIEALLDKKSNSMTLSENINALTDSYSIEESETIAETIYRELNLAQQDSTANSGSPTLRPLGTANISQTYCHGACHGACHSACHGSRGWR